MSVGIVCGIWYIVEKSVLPAARSPFRPVHVPGSVPVSALGASLADGPRQLRAPVHSATSLPAHCHSYLAISPAPAACEIQPVRPCRSLIPAVPPLSPSLTFRAFPFTQAAWRVPRVEPPAVQLLPAHLSCGDTLRDAARPLRCAAIPHPTIPTHLPHIHHIHARSWPPHPPAFTAY